MDRVRSRSSTSCLKVGLCEGTACQQSLIIIYLQRQRAGISINVNYLCHYILIWTHEPLRNVFSARLHLFPWLELVRRVTPWSIHYPSTLEFLSSTADRNCNIARCLYRSYNSWVQVDGRSIRWPSFRSLKSSSTGTPGYGEPPRVKISHSKTPKDHLR